MGGCFPLEILYKVVTKSYNPIHPDPYLPPVLMAFSCDSVAPPFTQSPSIPARRFQITMPRIHPLFPYDPLLSFHVVISQRGCATHDISLLFTVLYNKTNTWLIIHDEYVFMFYLHISVSFPHFLPYTFSILIQKSNSELNKYETRK